MLLMESLVHVTYNFFWSSTKQGKGKFYVTKFYTILSSFLDSNFTILYGFALAGEFASSELLGCWKAYKKSEKSRNTTAISYEFMSISNQMYLVTAKGI